LFETLAHACWWELNFLSNYSAIILNEACDRRQQTHSTGSCQAADRCNSFRDPPFRRSVVGGQGCPNLVG
jgi:hypothetical protein